MTRPRAEMQRLDDGSLPHSCWPGLYPLAYVTPQHDVLCAECANEYEASPRDCDASDLPIKQFINWEDPSLYCDECSERIPSAYAEPENK